MKILILLIVFLSGCGQRAFIKGNYDEVDRVNLLSDQWSETDMQVAVRDLTNSLGNSSYMRLHYGPAVTVAKRVTNSTSEQIDTQSILDMIRVESAKISQIVFLDVEARNDIQAELKYQSQQNGGPINRPGGHVGAEYILSGTLTSIVQQVGKDKTVYYKLTLNFTDIRTGVVIWSDHKEIRKIYKKRRV